MPCPGGELCAVPPLLPLGLRRCAVPMYPQPGLCRRCSCGSGCIGGSPAPLLPGAVPAWRSLYHSAVCVVFLHLLQESASRAAGEEGRGTSCPIRYLPLFPGLCPVSQHGLSLPIRKWLVEVEREQVLGSSQCIQLSMAVHGDGPQGAGEWPWSGSRWQLSPFSFTSPEILRSRLLL